MKRQLGVVTLCMIMQLFLVLLGGIFGDSIAAKEVFLVVGFVLPVLTIRFFCKTGTLTCAEISIAPHSKERFFSYLLPFIFPLLGTMMVISLLTSLAFSKAGINISNPIESMSGVEIFFFSLVIPAFFEELLIRGAILSLLLPLGKKFAVVVSATLFALMHINFYQMPYAFAAGLILGAVTASSASLLPAIALHFCNNLFSALLLLAHVRLESSLYTAIIISCVVIFIIFGALSLAYVYNRKNEKKYAGLSLLFAAGQNTMRQLAGSVLSPIWIYVAIALALAIVYV